MTVHQQLFQEGNLDVVKFLVDRSVSTTRGKNGITPFHMACYRGHLDVVAYLTIEQGMNPRAIDGHGRTPIEVARRAQRDEVVSFLERNSPDVTTSSDATCMTTFTTEDVPCGEVNCSVG
ncbi:MAG: ankyrin repeat domain-containing protein [Pseudomonadota bacterium]